MNAINLADMEEMLVKRRRRDQQAGKTEKSSKTAEAARTRQKVENIC